jgi:hypothetical protein
LLKAMLPADLARYKGFGAPDGVAAKLNPKKGEAYVIGPDGTDGVYHLRRRYSPDESQTPGLANIRNAPGVPARTREGDSPIPDSPAEGRTPLDSRWGTMKSGNGESSGNGFSGDSRYRESSRPLGEAREDSPAMGIAEEEGYTPAEEIQVLRAYAAILEEGGPVTRTAIKERLEWSSRQFSRIIKPVCDKHGIA